MRTKGTKSPTSSRYLFLLFSFVRYMNRVFLLLVCVAICVSSVLDLSFLHCRRL